MAQIVIMPKLGLTMTEGTVSQWLKKEGDAVKEGEPLFEVETDKLTNTMEAPATGTLLKILVTEGITVPILEKIGVIGNTDEDIGALISNGSSETAQEAAAPAPAAAPAAAPAEKKAGGRVIASPAAKKLAKEKGIDLALVTGTGPNGRITEDDVKNYTPALAAPADTEVRLITFNDLHGNLAAPS